MIQTIFCNRGSSSPDRERRCRLVLLVPVVLLLLVFLLTCAISCGSGPPGDEPEADATPVVTEEAEDSDEEEEIDAGKLIKEIWDVKARFVSYESELTIDRLNPDFMRNVLPHFDEVGYLNAKSYIHYVRAPKRYQLQMYDRGRGRYFYTFTSTDGYQFRLNPGFEEIGVHIPKDSEGVEYENIYNLTLFDHNPDGSLVSNRENPLNLLFPYAFKPFEATQEMRYMGKRTLMNMECYVVEIDSPTYGKSRIFITADENRDVIQVERLDRDDLVYARATYRNFYSFIKGGRLYTVCDIYMHGLPVLRATLNDKTLLSNQDEPRERPQTTEAPKVDKNDQIWRGGPFLTVGLIFLVLFLLVVLVIIGYRYWFYKAERPAFSREVILVEGNRAEEKISPVFEKLGIHFTPFTPQKLTQERELLDFKKKKRPRVVFVAPGMSSQSKGYNFLLKTYVRDGGRVVFFDHGVEQAQDMPFTPTFVPLDRSDPDNTYVIMPNWEKIWKLTSAEEIQKRTTAFLPYELIAKIHEENLEIDPILVVVNERTNLTAASICMVREGKGEYMIIQYRLLEAIVKLKFTSATAEKMLRDLLEYIFGKEKNLLFAPTWLMDMMGVKQPVKQNDAGEDEEEQEK